jgi:4-alpha-glucanotransferase
LYGQWLAQEQIDSLTSGCQAKGIKLCLDLPLGVDPHGYDTWRHSDIFALEVATGAPPDAFFSKGQNWGFAPLHPERIRQRDYRYVLEFLRFQMRHANFLRIDHVMGLHRLYWIPQGFPATEGAYVTYPAEEFYAILNLESHRHQTVLVGENLGTVPAQVNARMKRHQLRQMYVLQYEQRPDPERPLRAPPTRSVASLNTHDMPAFTAYWRGLDLADRVALGLLKKAELAPERARRREANHWLKRFLTANGFLKIGESRASKVLRACLKFLAASRAELVLANLEDLWGETRPQNTPGTVAQRPNWRRQTRLSLEQILRSRDLRECLGEIHKLRRKRR